MSKVFETTRVPGFNSSKQLWAKLQVNARQQKQGHDRSLAKISLEQVVLFEAHQIFHACLLSVFLRLPDTVWIDVDPDATRAVSLGRSDHDAPVATPKIVDDVTLLHVKQVLADTPGGASQRRIARRLGIFDELIRTRSCGKN